MATLESRISALQAKSKDAQTLEIVRYRSDGAPYSTFVPLMPGAVAPKGDVRIVRSYGVPA